MREAILRLAAALSVTVLTIGTHPSKAHTQEDTTLEVVSSTWNYEFDLDGIWPHRVHVGAEIRNPTSVYVADALVRFTLLTASGTEIAHDSSSPVQTHLRPGESTFFSDTFYSESALVALTSQVQFYAFGDVSSAGSYPYMSDPTPVFQDSGRLNGTVVYYGKFVNDTSETWKIACDTCPAVLSVGAYYVDGSLVDYQYSDQGPRGHLGPGQESVFKFRFDRLPSATFKLFTRVEALPRGEYATVWSTELLDTRLEDRAAGGKVLRISARLQNDSTVRAKPHAAIVGYDAQGRFIGFTTEYWSSEIRPRESSAFEVSIHPSDAPGGKPEDIKRIEFLIGSGATSHRAPPTATPTVTKTATTTPRPSTTPTPSNTPTPSMTPTASNTPTITLTPTDTPLPSPTPSPTETATPLPPWMRKLLLPIAWGR